MKALVGLAAILVLLAACGGASSGGAGSSTETAAGSLGSPPTKLDYVGKVDVICAKGSQEIGRAIRHRRAAAASVPGMLREQVVQIGRLKGPRERELRLIPILAAMKKGAAEIEANPRLAFSGRTALDEAVQLSRESGFLECGLLE